MTIDHNQCRDTDQRKREGVKFLTVLPLTLIKRLVPTLVSLIFNLKTFVRVKIEKNTEGIPENIVKEFEDMDDYGIDRCTTHPEENYNGFIRDESSSQDSASTMMRIVARSSLAKNFMVKHNVETFKRGRANVGGLKISEYYGAIDDMSEEFSAKQLVNAMFVVAGALHPKANIDSENCDLNAFINFVEWLSKALPWSMAGKYQRI